jgi:hypothetical protein
MAIRKSSSSGIPFGNTAGRPANPTLGQLYSNGQVGRLELYTSTGWQNIVQETPGIAGVTGTYNESAGSGTFVISGTNFVDGGIVYAVGTNAVEYQATTSTYNSIVQMTVLFTGLSPAYEPYDVKVVNPSNLFGLLPDAFFINDSPVWSTSSGSLGTYSSSVNIQLAATDDESNTITYSVTSGSLPTGLSLSSSGLISGTVTATPATYTFTVSASDGINTGQTRSFSITVPLVLTGGTLTSDATYYYRTFTATQNFVSNISLNADYLIVAGGGSGGVWSGVSGYRDGLKGTNSSFNSEIAIGGGGGKSWNNGANADGGSGGGGSGNRTAGGAATSGQGNAGGVGNDSLGSGGGGGAGAAGGVGNGSKHGDGGIGINWKSLGTFYAGGGGGGGASGTPANRGLGGSGGGGNGAVPGSANPIPSNGSSNTGGGGGGADAWWGQFHGGGGAGGLIQSTNTVSPNTYVVTVGGGAAAVGDYGTATVNDKNVLSGAGGSGIVVIRYTKASVGG